MTSTDNEIVFQSEDSMWRMLAEEDATGSVAKPFDMRRYDMADDRIYRLSVMIAEGKEPAERDQPEVERVTFVNKATWERLTRAYLGMEFTNWAPGWCFLILGKRISSSGADWVKSWS